MKKQDITAPQFVKLSALKEGDFFTLKAYDDADGVPESAVWVRGAYDRSAKKYDVYKFADVNHTAQKKSSAVVFAGFTF